MHPDMASSGQGDCLKVRTHRTCATSLRHTSASETLRRPSPHLGACAYYGIAPTCNVREPELHADVARAEGNYQAYIEDLKRRKGPSRFSKEEGP